MSSLTDRIIVLIINHLEHNITEAERRELEEWMNESALNKEAVATFLEEEKLHEGIRDMYQMRQKVWDRLQNQLDTSKVVPLRRLSPSRRIWWRYAAAVIVFLLLSIGGYFYFNNSQKQIAKTETQQQRFKNDVAPGGNKAILTLSNGSTILLDSAANGTLTQQGNTKIIKLDSGQLAYDAAGSNGEILYNTITTPKGGQYQVVLADGSKVWLNAASSLKYPTTFTGRERNVEMTGEVYFEVAHDAKKPFNVSVNGMNVQVLGTHFNINAYNEESTIGTTLLEGSVNVTKDKETALLKPGQQTQLFKSGELTAPKEVNIDEVIGWKDGFFHFESADLKTILRQFARWYDIEVVYEGAVTDRKFFGIVKRSNTLKKVLEMLQDNNIIYKIEGKKLIVKSS